MAKKTINQIFAPFLSGIEADIKSIQQYPNSEVIINRLCEMCENVRTALGKLHTAIKNGKELTNDELVKIYVNLNIDVNDAMNGIVEDRIEYLTVNNIAEEDIDHFINQEVFLSYTLFLDALHSDLCIPYCVNLHFPYHYLLWFQQQKMIREDAKNKKQE